MQGWNPQGHPWALYLEAVPYLFCAKCGAIAARKLVGLGTLCRDGVTKGAKHRLGRIWKGEDPYSGKPSLKEAVPHLVLELSPQTWADQVSELKGVKTPRGQVPTLGDGSIPRCVSVPLGLEVSEHEVEGV